MSRAAVLSVLQAAPGWVDRDDILSTVWPDTKPIIASNNLKVVIYNLRRIHGQTSIQTELDGHACFYRWNRRA